MVLRHSGFTLLELLVVIIISAVIVTIASTYGAETYYSYSARNSISQLKMLLYSARQQAIFNQSSVILCPSNDQLSCSHDWNHPLIIFNDANNNFFRDPNETLYATASESTKLESRTYSGRVIGFNSLGMAQLNNGSLAYCLKSKYEYKAKFIISRLGRIRIDDDNTPC